MKKSITKLWKTKNQGGNLVMKFNENLKYLRKKEGLTQEDLAEKLNVSRQSVTKWESGQSLPDIEKVKEIAYLFSVSVDSLVGDIESKTDNKIKKKIDDLGWFIFAFLILAIAIVISLHNFIADTFKNDDITIVATIVIVAVTFLVFISALKLYLRNTQDIILNMKDDQDGRNQRKKYIVKKSIFMFVNWCVFCLVTNLGLISDGMNVFLIDTIKAILLGLILDLLYVVYEYRSLEKKVKELNQ